MKMRRLLLLLSVTMPLSALAAAELAPVAHWPMDEGQGQVLSDRGPHRISAQAHGGQWVSLPKTKALALDGVSAYADCGEPAALDLRRQITVMLWLRPDSVPEREVGVCGKSQTSYALTYYKDGKCWWYISAGSNGVSAPVEATEWHHVAGTFDGITVKLYVDGALAASRPSTEGAINPGGVFTIGKIKSIAEYGETGLFAGQVAGLQVYDTALPVETIAAHYSAGQPAFAADGPGATTWQARPQKVRREAVPSRLEGLAAGTAEIRQAAAWDAREEGTGTAFTVRGEAPQERTMQWNRALTAAEQAPARYYMLTYRAQGLRRSFSPSFVVRVSGRNAAGAAVTAELLTCEQAINDLRTHVMLGRLPADFAPVSAQVEVSTTSDLACLWLDKLQLLAELPSLPLGATATGGTPGLVTLDLGKLCNDTLQAAVGRRLEAEERVVDPADGVPGSPAVLHGVPVAVRQSGPNLIRPADDSSVNEQTVAFLGEEVPRRWFMPAGREDVTEIPVGRSVSEAYLLLSLEAPVTVSRYSRPKVPFEISDIEGFAVELVYADGGTEWAFPYSMADEGFALRRMAGLYAVPADAGRRLQALRLHNRTWGVTVGLAAVTLNTAPTPRLAVFTGQPAPYRAASRPLPKDRVPLLRLDGSTLTAGNRFYEARFDLGTGFSLTGLQSRYAPEMPWRLAAASGLEVRHHGRVYTGKDFRVTDIRLQGTRASMLLTSRAEALPLRLEFALTVDSSPQMLWQARMINTGSVPLAAEVRFPVLKGLQLGKLEDTWLFFPEYRNVLTNRPGYHTATNDRSAPMQFMDFFNPGGAGLCVITHNLEGDTLDYTAAKDATGVAAAVSHPATYHELAPGQGRPLVETALGFHTGDWHDGMQQYQQWVATWFQPRYAKQREWWDRVWLVRAESLAEANSRRIFRTRGLYTGTPGQFRLDEVLQADREQWGMAPDLIHLSDWFHTERTEEGSWGDYRCTDYATGGLESFRSFVDELERKHKLPLSLYTIPDRASRATEAGKRYGEAGVARRSDGSPLVDDWSWSLCPDYKPWRDAFVEQMRQAQADIGHRAQYVDVFSYYRGHSCFSSDHGHDGPTVVNSATEKLIRQIRQTLPPEMALWSEYPLPDIATPYADGCISYYYLSLHELFAESHNLTEQAQWHSPPALNAYRFAFPHVKQIDFPVGIEGDYNWGRVRFIFFNGDGLMDCTWRLWSPRGRQLLGRGLKIQREYADCFSTLKPRMLVPTMAGQVYANAFPAARRTVWTLYNARFTSMKGNVLEVPHVAGARYRDAWNGCDLSPQIVGAKAVISLRLDPQGLGCVVQERP